MKHRPHSANLTVKGKRLIPRTVSIPSGFMKSGFWGLKFNVKFRSPRTPKPLSTPQITISSTISRAVDIAALELRARVPLNDARPRDDGEVMGVAPRIFASCAICRWLVPLDCCVSSRHVSAGRPLRLGTREST